MKIYSDFRKAVIDLGLKLTSPQAMKVSGNWQSTDSTNKFLELLNQSFQVPIRRDLFERELEPSQPWADTHFKERVSNIAHNPPPSHEIWPWAYKKNEEFTQDTKFSHTYPERMWPKKAWDAETRPANGVHTGIRYEYGDASDVLKLMRKDPNTRQAFLPIWFPEDTGANSGQRVPCTLGYHFIQREGFVHVTYYMRSCDYLRHMRDDIYLAIRLLDWVTKNISDSYQYQMGIFTMHIVSLHCFESDRYEIIKQLKKWQNPEN